MKKKRKHRVSTYHIVLKALGGKKWLKTATIEQIGRLESLKEFDEIEKLCRSGRWS